MQPVDTAAPRWLHVATIAFAVFLALLVVLANSGAGTHVLLQISRAVPGNDKTVHFALMGTMALLLNLSWGARRWRLGPVPVLKGTVLVAVVVTLEEWSQLFVRRRSFSLEDLAYDYLGILLIGQLAIWLVWWRRDDAQREEVDAHIR